MKTAKKKTTTRSAAHNKAIGEGIRRHYAKKKRAAKAAAKMAMKTKEAKKTKRSK